MRHEGWTQAEMCRQISGLKPARVSKTLRWLDELPAQYHDKVGRGDGLIPEKGAYMICDFPPEERGELCELFIAGKLTVEGLEARRKRLKGASREKRKPVKLKFGGVAATVSGNVAEALRGFIAKANEALKEMERKGWGDDFLPGLMK
jgi:hypothetical protein